MSNSQQRWPARNQLFSLPPTGALRQPTPEPDDPSFTASPRPCLCLLRSGTSSQGHRILPRPPNLMGALRQPAPEPDDPVLRRVSTSLPLSPEVGHFTRSQDPPTSSEPYG
ncbi:hypothetical protein C7M84_009297 [Penaeus vannamei]|uniref:Uncharacterized protein n=1 Tax=Penaeus vannamei TaxID=6689 RepID=A0A3R7QML6_PENVA|nr:uncharacterized protein LOC113811047 [Penaeus vannamei]ROT72323.1 hypothetical protein C7M84_009297 [Penaeus vannamei]